MAPVARELSRSWGVLEPLQRANSIQGQLGELHTALNLNADLPVTLIGSSWGGMLGYLFSAYYPGLVRKLILVGSGVYEHRYAAAIQETRLKRLPDQERSEALALLQALNSPVTQDKNLVMARLGRLFVAADAYNPLTLDTENLEVLFDVFLSVWNEATKLRRSGDLLNLGKQILCPVVAIHGEYDPHPAQGVRGPLSQVLRDFKFILVQRCGHLPWIEREARDRFFEILRRHLP